MARNSDHVTQDGTISDKLDVYIMGEEEANAYEPSPATVGKKKKKAVAKKDRLNS